MLRGVSQPEAMGRVSKVREGFTGDGGAGSVREKGSLETTSDSLTLQRGLLQHSIGRDLLKVTKLFREELGWVPGCSSPGVACISV